MLHHPNAIIERAGILKIVLMGLKKMNTAKTGERRKTS
jgi:hypothetical protein